MSEEWTENGVQHLLIYIYDASGAPIGMAYRDSTYSNGDFDFYLFAKNIQGDILYIYNTSGTRLATYTYDAWGKCYVTYQNGGASTAARYNPFRYRGYYYDTETGFYYLNSRYYDPELGRFLNADGYINGNGDLIGYNMFAYCGNNPVMFVDPSGETYNDAYYSDRSDNLLRRFFGVAAFAIASTAVVLYTAQVAYTRVDTLPGSIGISSVPKSKCREVAVADTSEKEKVGTDQTTKYRYRTASVIDGWVERGIPLTYSEAFAWAAQEHDLLCIDRAAAISIVKYFPSARYEPAHNKGKKGYLNHYHLSSAHKNHIWFYGP